MYSESLIGTEVSGQKHKTIFRGTICYLTGNPFVADNDQSVLANFHDGGILVDHHGKILAVGEFQGIAQRNAKAEIVNRKNCFILPGFIDCHTHFPQTFITGAFGEELLDWLERHTFPEEARYIDTNYAQKAANAFFQEAIANGTTTAIIFGAHFEAATAAAFAEAKKRNFRAIMGMTMSDRHLPHPLALPPDEALAACQRLINDWHGNGKIAYVVTPRFAGTCSPEMLENCRLLLEKHPDLYFQTHLNENHREINWIKDLFPDSRSYLHVYNKFGLLGPRSFFEHSIYSREAEIKLLAKTRSRVAHCPSSNMFLGSGFIPLKRYIDHDVQVALGTDIGAGTGFSMFAEMNNAYKIQALQMFALEHSKLAVMLTGVKLLYLATLAGAEALTMESTIGSLAPGRQADFIVVDPSLDPYFLARLENTHDIYERLFVLAILGSKQIIKEVYMDGRLAYSAESLDKTMRCKLSSC